MVLSKPRGPDDESLLVLHLCCILGIYVHYDFLRIKMKIKLV